MKAGKLKERIRFVRKENIQGDDGQFEETETEILQTYAAVRPISNSLDYIASMTNQTAFYEFRIRYRQDVVLRTGDLIDWRGRVLKIQEFPFNPELTEIKIIAKTENNSTSNGQI